MTTHTPLPVAGYTAQPDEKIALVNANKVLEERTLRQIDAMQGAAAEAGYDPRMIALARTKTQEAFMWLNRAVFQPTRIQIDD